MGKMGWELDYSVGNVEIVIHARLYCSGPRLCRLPVSTGLQWSLAFV